jgi:DNA-binding beta-propeller fold protein YncE
MATVNCLGSEPTPEGELFSQSDRSPQDVAFAPQGNRLAVSDRTAGRVVIIDVSRQQIVQEFSGLSRPAGLDWSLGGSRLYVSEQAGDAVAVLDLSAGRIVTRFATGSRPEGLKLSPLNRELLVLETGRDNLSVIDRDSGTTLRRIPVLRHPSGLAVIPGTHTAIVGHFLPASSALDPNVAAAVSLIDYGRGIVLTNWLLPTGSTLVRGVTVSPDGRWAYVAHVLARFHLPLTQLSRGWMTGNSISILDLRNCRLLATVLLDRIMEGAADPWDLRCTRDGRWLWITLSGVHQVARLDLAGLHRRLNGTIEITTTPPTGPGSVWDEIRRNPERLDLLMNDLDALSQAGLIEIFPLPGKGPRGLDLAPDQTCLAVASYFSGEILLLATDSGQVRTRIALAPPSMPAPGPERRGEQIFHDATYAFQHWLSCSTCHPEGRADGLNWDLLNDGIGSQKNTRSLLWAHRTPPVMSLGVRASMEIAVQAGFRNSQLCLPSLRELDDVRAYLRSLQPERSPYRLRDGSLTDRARRGQVIFQSPGSRCSLCHPAPLFTDLRLHAVGTSAIPGEDPPLDTPTLAEVWRTAPYLHHGGAATLKDMLTTWNQRQVHGKTAHLAQDDLDALIEYLLSL